MKDDCRSSKLLFELLTEKSLLFFTSYRIPLISSFIFGLLAHGFVFTNKYINHDEVYNLFGKGATIDSGRWGLSVLDCIFPNYSMPWIYGILTILFIAVSVCLIVQIFSISHFSLQILLAGIIVVFPLWTSTFAFMFTSCSYGLSFLLAVLSVAFLRKSHPFCLVLALGCGIYSVAIYQAYIAIIAALLVLVLFQELLLEQDLCLILKRGFFYIGFLILTLSLYYLAAQVIMILKDVAFNKYASERNSFSLTDLPADIMTAYSHFFQALETGEHALIPTVFSRRLHKLCFAACGILLVLLFLVKKMRMSRILFILALIVIFPLAVNCMYLFTPEAAIHTLVLCGMMTIYIPLVIMADLCISAITKVKCLDLLRRISLDILHFVLAAIIVCNIYFSNEAYLQLHLQYENTYAFYTSLLSDIRMHPEFDSDTKLAVIGHWHYPDYFFRKFEFTYHLFGHLNSSPGEYSMDQFLEYYIGLSIPFASDKESAEIRDSAQYQQMPDYPYYGSIQMIGDTLVVKLS